MTTSRTSIRRFGSGRAVTALILGTASLLATASCGDEPAPRAFRVWAASCSHVPADIRRGRQSLAEAIRQSEGKVDGAGEIDGATIGRFDHDTANAVHINGELLGRGQEIRIFDFPAKIDLTGGEFNLSLER